MSSIIRVDVEKVDTFLKLSERQDGSGNVDALKAAPHIFRRGGFW